ncbi:MAG: integrase family protein [Geobacteraceae bacterium]|nr:integrase family protein [Geobacteraceae bacterium]
MPRLKLTKDNIDNLAFADKGQIDYFDTDLKGFALRVGRDSKTFFVQIDVFDPSVKKYKTVKGKIGRYGEYTPKQARSKAPEIMQRLREGKPANAGTVPTLQDLYEYFLKTKPLAKATEYQYKIHVPQKFSSWLHLTLPSLVATLTPQVVIDRYQQVFEVNGPGAAYNSFKCLQSIINYGSVLYPQYITRNPVKTISDAKLWVERKAREDCLEPAQFKAFYDGLLKFTPIHRDAFLFALYQGLRPNEAQSIRWSDVDLGNKTAFIRHETEKSKRSYSIPLCKQSLQIMTRRNETREEGGVFVFPSDWRANKCGHVTLRAEKLRMRTGLDLTVHGLRRSFVTVGERLKLRREDLNLLTGHIDGTVTGKHYTRLTLDDLRPTLQRIANEIERLMIEGIAAKVISMTGTE